MVLKILNYINQPSTFWRKSAFDKVGMFDQSLRYCMDYDFWLRLSQLSQPHITDQVLSKFRIHSLSKGGSQFSKQFEEEHQVLSNYTHNSSILGLHKIHASAIVLAYKQLK